MGSTMFSVNYLNEWTVLLPLFIAVYFGTKFGKKMLGKLPESTFRMLFKVTLTVIAIRLVALELLQLL